MAQAQQENGAAWNHKGGCETTKAPREHGGGGSEPNKEETEVDGTRRHESGQTASDCESLHGRQKSDNGNSNRAVGGNRGMASMVNEGGVVGKRQQDTDLGKGTWTETRTGGCDQRQRCGQLEEIRDEFSGGSGDIPGSK